VRRALQLTCLTALLAAVFAPSAGASITLGQLAPGAVPPADCANPMAFDVLQPTVTSGNGYVSPVNGKITSWSHNAGPDAMQALAFKVFRNVSGTTFQVVAADIGFRPLISGNVNTFSGLSIPIQAGDVIGMNDGPPSACAFFVPGDSMTELSGDRQVGDPPAVFGARADRRMNLTAVVQPTNSFELGAVTRNKKKGTATVTVTVSNPGRLIASGKGVKGGAGKNAAAAGVVKLPIKAKGKKGRTLRRAGKVKLKVTVTYTPTGGDALKKPLKVKLKRN
jgi:hypothetical protein